MTAARAFGFCLTYKRTTEFRRLCDILRNHLANLNKRARLTPLFLLMLTSICGLQCTAKCTFVVRNRVHGGAQSQAAQH